MSEQKKLDEIVEESSVESDVIRSSLDETSLGDVPDNWGQIRLENIVNGSSYGAAESAEEFDPQEPRYVRITDINSLGRLKPDTKVSLSRKKSDGYLLDKGDLVFARSGASVGKTYLYRPQDGECAYAGYLIRQDIDTDVANAEFVYQYTDSPRYERWVARKQRTGAQPNINAQEYGNLLIPYPSLSEQRKIATVLYTVDRAIKKAEEIIRQSERVREGVTQDIFTTGYYNHSEYSDVRLGPVKTSTPEDWCVKSISDYFKIIDGDRGKNYPSGSDFSDQGYCLFLSATNVTDEGLKFDETEFITQEKDEELRKGKLKRGDIIMTTRGTVGNFGLYDESVNYDNIRINSGMVLLRPKDDIPSMKYYYHYFRSGIFQRQINATSYGTAQPQTSVTEIKKMGILEPGEDEKEQISELIEDVVLEIQTQKEYRDQLRLIKRGLMQDLLSGKVRTTDTNIEVPDEIAQYG